MSDPLIPPLIQRSHSTLFQTDGNTFTGSWRRAVLYAGGLINAQLYWPTYRQYKLPLVDAVRPLAVTLSYFIHKQY